MTERIDEILAITDQLDPALFAALDEADQRDAFDRAVDPDNPHRERALAILARVDPGPGGFLAAAASQVAFDARSDRSARIAAISLAGAVGSEAAGWVQEQAVHAQDPLVGLAAWRTLQQVARSDRLAELQQVAPPSDDVVGRQAEFALAVIAYRAGASGFELHVPDETEFRVVERDEQPLHAISQSPVTDADFERVRGLPTGELYGLAPSAAATTVLDCGNDHMLVCLDPDVQEGIPWTLKQSPLLSGLVMLLDPPGLGYSVRYLILTWPDGQGGFHVALHQPDGTQAYYGRARSESITDTEATVGSFFALARPGIERNAVSFVVSPTGVVVTGDQVAATEIAGDRLMPEPD